MSLIDTGARLGSGGNSLVSLADSDSDIAVAEHIVPKGTVTFQEGEVSTTTTIEISFTVSVRLAGWTAYLTGPGDPQIGLNRSMSVLGMMCWYVWEIRRIRRKPKSGQIHAGKFCDNW